MYAADREALLRGESVRVSPLIWKSHRIKRVVRSTVAAETMAALEAVEHAEVMRGHFAELFEGIDYHSYDEDIRQISVIHLTDCRSLYDFLHRRGTVPSERRLLIDIEALYGMSLRRMGLFRVGSTRSRCWPIASPRMTCSRLTILDMFFVMLRIK